MGMHVPPHDATRAFARFKTRLQTPKPSSLNPEPQTVNLVGTLYPNP